MNKFYAKFDENGERVTTVVAGIHFQTEQELAQYLGNGFIPITNLEQKLYASGDFVLDLTTLKPKVREIGFQVFRDIKKAEAKKLFVQKRDAIRWINSYGYDCTSEDITNFFAAKDSLRDALDSWNGVGDEPTTAYKVWVNAIEKAVVQLNMTEIKLVQGVVRNSQFEAYAWYETIAGQIDNCDTQEQLDAISLS